MTNTKIFNLAGIGVQLIGLLVLTRIDLLTLRHNESVDALRDSVMVDVFEAGLAGIEHEPSTQERESALLHTKLQGTNHYFRVGLALTCLGTFLQLIGTAVGE